MRRVLLPREYRISRCLGLIRAAGVPEGDPAVFRRWKPSSTVVAKTVPLGFLLAYSGCVIERMHLPELGVLHRR